MIASQPAAHHLDAEVIHQRWDNSIPPRLSIRPGDTVVFDTRDASNRFYTPQSRHEDVLRRVFSGHPLTGPVWVEGAEPGDTLVVEILEVRPAAFGWTAIREGRGLLQEDFKGPYLKIWDLSNGSTAQLRPGIEVPLEPFCGVMGVALDEPGEFTTAPPRKNGGNMDIKQLTAGTTLYLPVWVEGGLFSVGDAHAAQGDGEVCVTAIEMNSRTTLRLGLQKGRRLAEPQFETSGPITVRTNTAGFYVTTAHHTDLMEATKNAVRHMVDHLGQAHGLSPEEAYILSSVAVDLKISEVVDAPNWIVSAFLPKALFTGPKS